MQFCVGHRNTYRPPLLRVISTCRPVNFLSQRKQTRLSSSEFQWRNGSAARNAASFSPASKCAFRSILVVENYGGAVADNNRAALARKTKRIPDNAADATRNQPADRLPNSIRNYASDKLRFD